MATPRITVKDLTGLDDNGHLNFVAEYCKDFNGVRAAEASGYSRPYASVLMQREDIKTAINHVLARRLETSDITAEWALMEAVDNHKIARQEGKYSASNTALNLIMKHRAVDAMSAERVEIASDEAIRDRLLRGRTRAEKKELTFI